MITTGPYRFSHLCREDKIRLQNLIQELATASKSLNEKDKLISNLQNTLDNKNKEKYKIESEKNGESSLYYESQTITHNLISCT